MQKLKDNTNDKERLFIFICGQPKLIKSKIAVLPSEIVFKCMDIKRQDKYKLQNIKIRLIKGHWDFDVYGTARADKKMVMIIH